MVGEAGDARNAVFQTRATKPDVILMDVVMPGKTGSRRSRTFSTTHPRRRC